MGYLEPFINDRRLSASFRFITVTFRAHLLLGSLSVSFNLLPPTPLPLPLSMNGIVFRVLSSDHQKKNNPHTLEFNFHIKLNGTTGRFFLAKHKHGNLWRY